MAKKHNGTGSSELLQFDSRTKAVSAQAHIMDNMKEKISRVREHARNSSKDDIIQVLHHFDGDVEKSIDAYRQDGAHEILSQWNIPNRRGKGGNSQKRNKKKKHKGGQSGPDSSSVAVSQSGDVTTEDRQPTVPNNNNNVEKPTHPRIESISHANGHVPSNNNVMPKDSSTVQSQPRREPNRSRRESPKLRQEQTTGSSRSPRREPRQDSQPKQNNRDLIDHGSGGTGEARNQKPYDSRGQGKGQRLPPPRKNEAESHRGQAFRPSQQSGRRRNISEGSDKAGKGDRERTTSESSTSQDKTKPKKPSSVLERSSKDLQRTQVSLNRHKILLNEECDRSEKRLRKAFQDARQLLEQREMEMMRQLKEVKRQSTTLLENRQERALELKMQTNRAPSMTEQQLTELKAEIKHFVSERKVDEEIGRTMRFTWNPDPLEQAIKTMGEVIPVKTTYSTRRPSITSDTSGTFSRTTSVSEDPSGPLSRSTSQIDSSVPPTPTTPDMDMKAEVENFAARLQRSLDSRGGPRRPRNDRSRSQGRAGNDRRGQGNQGQRNQDGLKGQQSQDNRDQSNRGQGQGRRNRGGPNREQGRPNRGKDQGPQNRREQDRERLSSSSSTGKGEESPDGSPKKNRNQRRREQYRRRHNQDNGADSENKDAMPEANNAKSGNRDSQPMTSDIKDSKVDVADSKPKSSTDSKNDKIDAKHESLVNGTTESVPETKEVHDENDAGRADKHVDSISKPERPKELNITPNGPKVSETETDAASNHIGETQHSPNKESKRNVIPNGEIHVEDKPLKDVHSNQSSDKPVMNGSLNSSNEVSPLDPVKDGVDEALPQRKPRERKERQKVPTEVVKEVSAMNGVVASGDGMTVEH